MKGVGDWVGLLGLITVTVLAAPAFSDSDANTTLTARAASNRVIDPPPSNASSAGEQIYNYYCYQCHGYSGNAHTLASAYLDPRPRDFATSDPGQLTRARMIDAVRAGRPGTAMVSFTTALSDDKIEEVVDYIRRRFMQGEKPALAYHTRENGWANHQRYRLAFPFATGVISLDAPWDTHTVEQRRGRRMFLGACISCHDRAPARSAGGTLRAPDEQHR